MQDDQVLCSLMMHNEESDVRSLHRNRIRQMFQDQFGVHPQDDIDQMVMAEIDQDYNHEEHASTSH
jgi:hypothetical protein